jgi:hypothetical protein
LGCGKSAPGFEKNSGGFVWICGRTVCAASEAQSRFGRNRGSLHEEEKGMRRRTSRSGEAQKLFKLSSRSEICSCQAESGEWPVLNSAGFIVQGLLLLLLTLISLRLGRHVGMDVAVAD